MFRGNSAIPLSGGALSSLFLPRFRTIDIAELVPLIWSRFGSGSYSRVVSTLVNVCSPFSGFSTGYKSNPPERACPLGSHLLFTFSIKANTEWEVESLQVNTLSIRSTCWGSNGDDRRFLTIGISSVEAARLGLIHVQTNEINYLYRLLGIIFRSVFMHYSPGQIDDLKRGQDVSLDLDLFACKDKYLNQPLSGITRYPYWAWRYNKAIWNLAPNVIPYRNVAPGLALYYFMFLTGLTLLRPDKDGMTKLLGLTVDREGQEGIGISKVLVQSLLTFTQYLNNPSDYQFELIDLVAPAVIASLIYSGQTKVTLGRLSYISDLRDITVALADQLRGGLKHGSLAQTFMPYEKVAYSLIFGDQQLINNLIEGIDL